MAVRSAPARSAVPAPVTPTVPDPLRSDPLVPSRATSVAPDPLPPALATPVAPVLSAAVLGPVPSGPAQRLVRPGRTAAEVMRAELRAVPVGTAALFEVDVALRLFAPPPGGEESRTLAETDSGCLLMETDSVEIAFRMMRLLAAVTWSCVVPVLPATFQVLLPAPAHERLVRELGHAWRTGRQALTRGGVEVPPGRRARAAEAAWRAALLASVTGPIPGSVSVEVPSRTLASMLEVAAGLLDVPVARDDDDPNVVTVFHRAHVRRLLAAVGPRPTTRPWPTP